MRKGLGIIAIIFLLFITACSNENGEENATDESNSDGEKETITFDQTGWSSTKVPTEIAKQILEEAGYEVEVSLLDQPIIFEGLAEQEVDFFMDAWLPYTEVALWDEYEDVLIEVAESYTDAPLGWAVPSYVEEDTIEDIKKNPEKFDGTVYTIGAGIVDISEKVLTDYGLDMYELAYSSEGAILSELDASIGREEPVIVTRWRPYSMFIQYDLKFLEEPKENFKFDNIYVLSYKGIEEIHPEAYDILSNWSIEVDDLEQMMYGYKVDGIPFEESAESWIEANRDQVDDMLGK